MKQTFNRSISKFVSAVLIAALTFLVSSLPVEAQASPASLDGAPATSEAKTELDSSCVNQIRMQDATVSELDLTTICTVTSIYKSRIDSVPVNFLASRIIAPIESTVYSKSWEIEKIGVTYSEISKGKFYYDGSQVWSTKTYRGYKGYHQCQAAGSWGITVDVSVLSCPTSYTNGGTTVVDRENYKVSAFVNGFPVYWVLAMSELSNYDGSTYARNF